MKTTVKTIRLHDFEVQDYLDLLREKVRAQVRTALYWKKSYSHLKEDGYHDYLEWAKRDAERARSLARRLGVHFGKEDLSVVLARKARFHAQLNQRRAA